MNDSQQEILLRLEELKKWQVQEQEKLTQKQSNQRKTLSDEQLKMIEFLGITKTSSMEQSLQTFMEQTNLESENEYEDIILQDAISPARSDTDNSENSDAENEIQNVSLNAKAPQLSPLKNQNIEMTEYPTEISDKPVIKRRYLKRGEGLEQRFKVHPDSFKLDKLPKYKFAGLRNHKFLKKTQKSSVTNPSVTNEPKVHKDSGNKRKNFPIRKSTDLEVPQNCKLVNNQPKITESAEAQEVEKKVNKWFKDFEKPVDLSTPRITKHLKKFPKAFCWAKILKANNECIDSPDLKNLMPNRIENKDSMKLDDLNLFELLEERISSASFSSNSSSIYRLLEAMNVDANESPVKTIINPEDALIEKTSGINLNLEPHPQTLKNHHISIDDSITSNASNESEPNDENSSTEYEDEDQQQQSRNHVRFAENVVLMGKDDSQTDATITDADTMLSTDLDAVELSKTSTPNEKQQFHLFKKKLLGHKAIETKEFKKQSRRSVERDLEVKEKQENELTVQSDLLKKKLEQLEQEIDNFRTQNTAILQIRQELELQKIQLENDREELLERAKDDQIKIEIYLHDERLKIEAEKQKYEKLVEKAKVPSKKEREEIINLKSTIDDLKIELKAKEARHGSAQARYRSQNKQLERDYQAQNIEIDALKKENKKLELENARLRRETNNKMLQEINKNIAKLAPLEERQSLNQHPPPKSVKSNIGISRRSDPVQTNTANKKKFASVPNLNAKSESEDEADFICSSDDDSSDSAIITSKSKLFKKKLQIQQQVPKTSFKSDTNKENEQLSKKCGSEPVQRQSKGSSTEMLESMKRELMNSDGSKDIWYPNGNLKKISADGMLIRMLYYNKDIKETNVNEGTIKYYYADQNTWHTTYIDGLEILEYPDGQTEHRYKDGVVEIHYPNGSIRLTNSVTTDDVLEEWRYPDGTNIKVYKDSTKILDFPNGQREIHTSNHKRREYPDGTIKLVYEDGSQETRYSNGRIRIKGKDGTLISDTENARLSR